LAANSSCTFSIQFGANLIGIYTTTYTVITSGGNATTAVIGNNLYQPELSPNPVEFSSPSGVESATQVVTLLNPLNAPITIVSDTFGASGDGTFAIRSQTCGATLAAGASCTYSLVFGAAGSGSITGSFTVATSNGTKSVTLIGTITPPNAVKPLVTLGSKANPAAEGQTVLLSSEVKGGSATAPTGRVEIKEGRTVLAAAMLFEGAASFKLSGLSAGWHSLIAVYLGDKTHAASESPAFKQVVTK
jgi:hypothetical protein